MKEQIKERRIIIDAISQLVKDLDYSHLEVDLTLKHQGESVEQFTKRCHLENLGKKIFKQSTERNECYKSLILAKAWLGKMLGELGETTPYVNDGNRKSIEDIEPAADKGFKYIQISETEDYIINDGIKWSSLNYIEKVDWLREEIKNINHRTIPKIPSERREDNRHPMIHYYRLYYHKCLNEARFWLGFELQRIKENK